MISWGGTRRDWGGICPPSLYVKKGPECWCPAKQANPYIPVQRKQVTRGFIFVFIYIELSQIYKSIFKLNINYSNSHIVQDERKEISCESPLAWRRLDAAWMQLCL